MRLVPSWRLNLIPQRSAERSHSLAGDGQAVDRDQDEKKEKGGNYHATNAASSSRRGFQDRFAGWQDVSGGDVTADGLGRGAGSCIAVAERLHREETHSVFGILTLGLVCQDWELFNYPRWISIASDHRKSIV